ncbi:type IV secretion system effector Ats1 [Anaplasma phagocytophilum str. Norway variant1]|uniref:Type IV secretion system effector Ats1 n=1 Tax=Anaplasma phagocytophilum str. Norway variant1 TaxID=1392506 RepID=A0A7H9E0L9_ANAPH|nr:type IV secretion system effector Ats1 [Anaplasma phagocytophilum]QLL66866.1 type IV secretion system effector Ats1 [Anaplasma phagocytophilum str. Norway variant1]
MLIRRILTTSRNVAARIVSGLTAPATENTSARTSRNLLGTTGNFFNGLMGKGKPFYHRASEMQNLPWDKERGTKISSHYAQTGQLVLQIGDGRVSEGALQMLEALDNSDVGELDPSSKGLNPGMDIGARMDHNRAKNECEALLDLRKKLEETGGKISVERTGDGFTRMLVIKIDTKNKSEEEVEKEVQLVLGTLGVGSKILAKSIAKELMHQAKTKDMNALAPVSHTPPAQSKSDSDIPENSEKSASADDKNRSQTPDQEENSPRDTTRRNSTPNGEERIFSLSGDASPRRPSSGAGTDQAVQQAHFLRDSEDRVHGSSGVTNQGQDMQEAVLSAARGLSDVSHDDSTQTQGNPTVTPLVSAQNRGPETHGKGTR